MTTWTTAATQAEVWASLSLPSSVFTPSTTQAEIWTSRDRTDRVFSPLVFALHPVFDTGQAGSYWPIKTIQTEAWTAVP